MKKMIKVSVLLSLLLSIIFSLAKVYTDIPKFEYRISHLDIDSNHNIYILLSTGTKDHILKLNKQLETVYIYSQDKLNKNKISNVEDIAQSQGNIYLLRTVTDTKTNVRKQQVLYLKAEKITSKAKEVTPIQVDEEIYYKKLNVSGDNTESIIKLLGYNEKQDKIKEKTYKYLIDKKENAQVVQEDLYSYQGKSGIYSLFRVKNQIGCISKEGQLYMNNGKAMERQEIKDLNDVESPVLMAVTDAADNLYAMQQRSGNIRKINLDNYTSKLVYWGDTFILENIAIPYQNSYELAFLDENTIAAATDMDQDTPLKFMITNNGITNSDNIEHFGLAFDNVIRLAGRYFIIYYISILSILLAVFSSIKLVKNSKTVLFKVAACIIPIIIGGFAVVAVVVNVWYFGLIETEGQNELQNNANLIESKLKITEIENLQGSSSYGDSSYQYLQKTLNQGTTSNRLILVKEGELFTGVDDDHPLFYKLKHFKKAKELDVYKSVVEEKVPKQAEMTYPKGQYLVWITPIINQDNQVIALLETSKNKADNSELKQAFIKWIVSVTIGALIIILVAIVFIIKKILKPIHEIEANLQEFAVTRQSKEINVYSNDEFYRMSKILNNMLENTQVQLYNLSRISDMYFRFIPERYFTLLKKSIADVKLGDSILINRPIAITSVYYMNTEEVNKSFSIVNKLVSEYEGVLAIDNRHLSDLTAIYSEDIEKALEAELLIADTIETENLNCKPEFVTVFDKMEVQLEIGGDEERLAVVILSKRLDCIYESMPLFRKSGCNMIITQEILDEIHDEGRYQYRYIGYILDQNKTKIHLYDFFEADKKEIREIKQETNFIFAKAVECFYKRDFYQAKNLFSIVIRENKGDEVARWYIFRCDELYRKSSSEDELSLVGYQKQSIKFKE